MTPHSTNDIERIAIETYQAVLDGNPKIFPSGFWDAERGERRAIAITRWLFEEKLNIPLRKIPKTANRAFFAKHKLAGMIPKVFNNSYIDAVMTVYPNAFRITDFRRVPNEYWQGLEGKEHAREETRYLIERVVGSDETSLRDSMQRVSVDTFVNNHLFGMLGIVYGGSPYEALRDAYPEIDFDEWDLGTVRQGFFSDPAAREKTIKKIREEIEKQHIKVAQLPELVSKRFFEGIGLKRPLRLFRHSPIEAIKAAFPELQDLNEWEFKYVPNGFWQGEEGRENARRATRWLVEKLQVPIDELPKRTNVRMFKENNLGTMLGIVYSHYPVRAIMDAYPEMHFMELDFERVPRGYWQGEEGRENAIEAIKELIDNRLKIPHEELPQRVSLYTFTRNRLRSVLSVFEESPADAIIAAFPEEGFRREDFRCFHHRAKIGKIFELVLCDIWEAFGQIKGRDYIFNRPYSPEIIDRPDFQFLSPYFKQLFNVNPESTIWGDAKIAPKTFFESKTSKYLKHVDHLVVIILRGEEPTGDDCQEKLFPSTAYDWRDCKEYLAEGRLSFFKINRLYPKLKEMVREDIIKDLKTLREERIPSKYHQVKEQLSLVLEE